MAADPEALGQLFRAVDTDNSGTIDERELSAICPDLTEDEVHYVFGELDVDGDGEISLEEFSKGFQDIRSALAAGTQAKDSRGAGASGGAAESTPRKARLRGRGRREVQKEEEEEDEEGTADTNAFVGSLQDGFSALTW